METIALFLISGALGAITKDIVQDGKLQLPFVSEGSLVLGFIGGMIVGAFIGYVVDHSFITAALGGYVGTSAISHLLPSNKKEPE
jgi:hypothetical protein